MADNVLSINFLAVVGIGVALSIGVGISLVLARMRKHKRIGRLLLEFKIAIRKLTREIEKAKGGIFNYRQEFEDLTKEKLDLLEKMNALIDLLYGMYLAKEWDEIKAELFDLDELVITNEMVLAVIKEE